MKNFENFKKSILSELEEKSPMFEGIDIDMINRIVSFNNTHEFNVNTSEIINPTYHIINGYDVISIFKRIKNDFNTDGNPLIKALKGIDGWKFNNINDIKALLKQFIKISNKIDEKYDTIITIPSSNPLNINFLHRLNKIIKCDNEIVDFFRKLETDDVLDNGLNLDLIRKSNNPEEIMNNIQKMIYEMNIKNNRIFSFKYVNPVEYRKYFKKTMDYNQSEVLKYSDKINGKNILILDDTISKGGTISETCENILNSFEPKKITIITLFSPLN